MGEQYRTGRKRPHQAIYIDNGTGNPEDDPTWGSHLVERLNAGAERVEQGDGGG